MTVLSHPTGDYTADRTVFLHLPDEKTRAIVRSVCDRLGHSVFDATISPDRETDWIAVPYCIRVLDTKWFLAHEKDIQHHHYEEGDDTVEIVIGQDAIPRYDPRYLIKMNEVEPTALTKILEIEKDRFERNRSLTDLYTRFISETLGRLRSTGESLAQLSAPFLLSIPPGYMSVSPKVMIFGQQTHGWCGGSFGRGSTPDESPVEWELQDEYRCFNLGEWYDHRSSPFWRFAHDLASRLTGSDRVDSFLWNNVIKCDYGRAAPSGKILRAITDPSVFEREISIANADVVVFVTGPNYDHHLEAAFPGSVLVEVPGESPRSLAHVEYPILPRLSFRTYHPNYLSRAKIFDQTLGRLIQLCAT